MVMEIEYEIVTVIEHGLAENRYRLSILTIDRFDYVHRAVSCARSVAS